MNKLVLLMLSSLLLSACGTLTGIPSHGGGKRFAVEQELVAASSQQTRTAPSPHQHKPPPA